MSRSAWTGMFSFGMVNIPSFLVSSDETDNEIDSLAEIFLEIREKNRAKRNFKIHQFTQQQQFFKDMGELKSMPMPAKHVMQIHGFLPAKEIDTVCYDKSFMLMPENGAAEPLVLLIDALSDKELIGIGTIHLRNKPTMCAVHTKRGFLMCNTLLYPDQLSDESASTHLNKTFKEALETFEKKVEEGAKHEKSANAS